MSDLRGIVSTLLSNEPPVASASGVLAYLLYFKHGEKSMYPWAYLYAYLYAILIIGVAKHTFQNISLIQSSIESTSLVLLHLITLYASLLVYRGFFNPLNRFPGPLPARFSKLYMVYRNYKSNLHCHHELYKLHQKYGRYVRIGPNDLSVVDPDGMRVVLGTNSKCRKSDWYGQDFPHISINTTRDRAAHDRRRRILAPAFQDSSLRQYGSLIQKHHGRLLRRIEEHVGVPMNVTKWFGLHGYDMMGELVFSRSFDLLETGENAEAIRLIGEGLYPQGFAFPTWLYRVFTKLPAVGAGYRQFVALAARQLDERMEDQSKTAHQDMLEPLLAYHEKLGSAKDKEAHVSLLRGDSRMLIVAGSDTTSTTLIHLCYRLCKEKGLVDRLREELAPLISNIFSVTYADLKGAQLLHGCINETLRLHYPGPSGFFRKVPEEGIAIGETVIPGNTIIQMPPHVMGLDEDLYEQSRDFVPERWYSKPEMVKHKDAFLPFLQGSESCIGKQLAFIQLTTVVAQIVLRFDMSFAPGEDGTRLIKESLDLAMLHPDSLELVFTPRDTSV